LSGGWKCWAWSPVPAWGFVLAAIVLAHYSYVYFELPLIPRGASVKPATVVKPGLVSQGRV
jgi:hypothetical protein